METSGDRFTNLDVFMRMGLRELSIIGYFPEFVFQFFHGAGACGGSVSNFYTILFFPL